MNKTTIPHHVVELPPERRAIANVLDLSWRKHCMYGLLEVDVTVPMRHLEKHKEQTGESLSFTGYLVSCIACALDENRSLQASRKGQKQLVVFDDVNVTLMMERSMGEKRVIMGHIIQGANHKTFQQIHEEIRFTQSQPVPPGGGAVAWFRYAMLLPWPLSALFNALLKMTVRHDPMMWASMGGTVSVSAVGMFGKGMGGWGLVPAGYPLDLIVGGIALKPAVVDGRIEPREMLCLTLVFDHDVIDGAPATRFACRLVELIETGHGLEEW